MHATDPDGTVPTLTAIGIPTNATFVDSLNGAGSFVFNPDYTQSGAINVTFISSDGTLADSEVVAITVTNVNLPPVLDSIRAKTVAENGNLTFRTHATDPDGTIPTLTAVGVPLNATFVDSLNGAGSFVFNPDFTQSGVINVTFITSDGTLADSEVVAITVTNTNRSPVLDSIRAQTVAENANLTFRTHAADPDGNIPTLTAVGAPLNATFVDSLNGAGSFVFNPSFAQSGVYNVTFIASDGTLADSEVVAITVTNTNRDPVLDSIRAKTVAENANLTFRIHATDPDGNAPAFTALGVPANAALVDSGNGAGSFVFNPDFNQSGVFNVTFIASDGTLADSELVTITVTNTNRTPVLDSIRTRTITEGGTLSIRVHAVDADGDLITLFTSFLPQNAVFVDSGNGAGLFTFQPSFVQSGTYFISFAAEDPAGAIDNELVRINVLEAGNQCPVLDPIGPKFVQESILLRFRTHATDPDATIPSLTAVNLPLHATFVDSTNGAGSFSFTPDNTQSGTFNVTFIASDGTLADSEIVVITVSNVNLPPVLDSIRAKTVAEGANLSVRVHATDPDGNAPSLSAVGLPVNAAFVDSLNGAGSFVFNPDFTQSGVFNVTFITSDGFLADSEVVAITVTNTNRAPVLDSIRAKSVAENANLTFRTHAVDPDGNIPTLTAIGVPLNATFVDSLNGAGSFVFNPDFTQSGVFNVTFITSDGTLADSEVVVITVTNTNRPPVLDSIRAKTVAENANLTFRAHATDPDGTIPTLAVVGAPLNSTFVDSLNGAGSFVLNPDFTQAGVYNVTFITSDGTLADSELVVITVTNTNRAPVLDSIRAQTVAENTNLTFRTHATDPDGTIPTLTALGVPANATFVDSLNGAGSFVFNPSFTQSGVFNVTFITSDGTLADSEVVTITVTNTNRPPVLDPIGAKSVLEGGTLVFRTHGSDPDGTIPTFVALGVPLNATFVDSLNGAGSFTFNPAFSQSGTYPVTFITTDGSLADSEIVVITVSNTNLAPVLDSIRAKTVAEGATLSFRAHATDPDATIPSLTAVNLPLNAVFVDSGNGAGSFTFNPSYTQAGSYNVTFISSDGSLADSELVVITVTNTNLPPVLDSIRARTVAENANLSFRTHATDPDGNIPNLSAVGVPLHATFVDSLNGSGSLVFNPDFTQAGVFNVTFIASDGILADSEIVVITVTNVNRPPVLDSIRARTVAENVNLTFRTHASDPDGAIPTLTALGVPVNATFVDSLNGAGSFSFNPDFTQTGVYNVTFIASDGTLADSELVTITVTNTDRAPVLDSIRAQSVAENANLTFRTQATDPDGTTPTLTAVGVPLNATFVDSLNGAGSFVFNPDFSQSGVYNVTFIASDGTLADSELVTITVTNTNRPPVLDPIGAKSVLEGGTLVFRTHGSDPDGTVPSFAALGVPLNATFVDSLNGAGSFTFNPAFSQSGTYPVTFITTDGSLADSEVVVITVSNTNLSPVLDSIRAKTVAEGANLTFRTHATDPDGTIPSLSAVGVPLNATFVDSLNGAGSLVFNPDYTQSGVFSVTFIASDGSLADSEVVTITVTNTNLPPVLDSIRAKTVAENANLTFRTHATDPDGTIPTLAVAGAPLNSAFVDSLNGAGSFVFNPDFTQAGVYNVTFVTSDGTLADSELVVITVTNTNRAPVLDSIHAKTVAENANLTFRTHASDPDGAIPTLTALGVPVNATFVDSLNGAGSFVFNPDFSQAGVFNVTFIPSDGSLADS
ncbi:MAG: tandem-95 repeat protein [candidate division Zixibacteria bacterium]|nr:tandem-95 repeat protein [candidate division Zixibacteria bacterium]